MFEAKTPEAAAYLAQREATERGVRQIWIRVAIALAVALAISVSTNVYNAVTTSQIKETVNSHTTTLTNQAKCEEDSFNAILKDARLAFTGDKNPKDYAKAPESC